MCGEDEFVSKMKQNRFMDCNKKLTNSHTKLSTRITFVMQHRSEVNVTHLIYVCNQCNSYKPFSHMSECVACVCVCELLYLYAKCSNRHSNTHTHALRQTHIYSSLVNEGVCV